MNRNLVKNIIIVAALFSCSGTKSAGQPERESQGPKIDAVVDAAAEFGLDQRVIMVAAHTQSNFGEWGATQKTFLVESGQPSVWGPDESNATDFKTQVRNFSSRLSKLTTDKPPRDYFDWYVQAANTIVGYSEVDQNVRDAKLRIALLQMIQAHNNGFYVYLGETEGIGVPAADESQLIQVQSLDPGQSRFLGNFRVSSDFSVSQYLPGNPLAQTGRKIAKTADVNPTIPGLGFPKIVLNWCPSSPLMCFEHLRKSVDASAHLFSYRGRNGEREIVQFHDLNAELKAYGKTRGSTIVITISGNAGASKQTINPAWIDWEDYVALRQTSISVLNQLAREWEQPAIESTDLSKFITIENDLAMENTAVPLTNAFGMPTYWDDQLFQEVLALPGALRPVGQTRIESPSEGSLQNQDATSVIFYPDPDADEVRIYQDIENPQFGLAWDLIDKRDISKSSPRIELIREFRRKGAQSNRIRAIKIVSRKQMGTILSSRIVRFKTTDSQ